jgi:hypothetical protein
MEWYSTETDRDSLTISRYLLQIQTAVNCRQAFSIILLDQVAKNITDAQLGLIADYMMHKAGAGAPAAKTPDF